jgi:membrane-associated phospholipid phosphatase
MPLLKRTLFAIKTISITIALLFALSNQSIAQSNEAKWLHDINPSQTHSQFWINTSKSVYPLSIAAPAAILTTAFIKHDKQLQKKGWEVLGAVGINLVITQGLKYTFNRKRPYEDYPGYIIPYDNDNGPSFPSAHTSTAFATATTLSIQCKKWYVVVPSFAWATAVGYSRLNLGEHYPTDVFAGAAVGIGSAYLSHWLNKKLFAKKQ